MPLIQGYVARKRRDDTSRIDFLTDIEHCEWLIDRHKRKLAPAVLAIDEKFMPISEVEKMLLEIDAAIMSDRAQMAIKHVAAKYNIILPP